MLLNPDFQRRPHWKPAAKSYLLDTIARGYPIPPVFIRERAKPSELEPKREVVDGQQRLRTLIAFIAPNSLGDYDEAKDAFVVSKKHNPKIANKKFKDLDSDSKRLFLDYEIATHVLPSGTDDRIILQIFARMNATGTTLNAQELRNAEFFGDFKNVSYELAYEQLERWRNWSVFTADRIARMDEVEMTSDLLSLIVNGIGGKSKAALNRVYEENDEKFPYKGEISRRFRSTMSEIEAVYGERLSGSAFSRAALFYTLFGIFYDALFGMKSGLNTRKKVKRLPRGVADKLDGISKKIKNDTVPKSYADAFEKATADKGRRDRRFEYVKKGL